MLPRPLTDRRLIETKIINIISVCLVRIVNVEASVGEGETCTCLMLWCFMYVSCMSCILRVSIHAHLHISMGIDVAFYELGGSALAVMFDIVPKH